MMSSQLVPAGFWFLGEIKLETIVALLALIALIVIALSLPGVVRNSIDTGLNLKGLENDLRNIQNLSDDVSSRLEDLDLWLKAVEKTNNRRSQVQTLFGTVVGLVGGYSVGWIETGAGLFSGDQLMRLGLAVIASLGTAMLLPMFVLPVVDRLLARWGRGDLTDLEVSAR